MTFPNFLTLIRIILTPVFVIFLLRNKPLYALLVFTAAGLSDGLDGFVARCFDQKSDLGAYLDPIADKLLLSSAYISLAFLYFLPPWLTVLVITRDVIILLGVAILSMNNLHPEIRPSLVSKLTTVAQLTTIFLVLLNANVNGLYGLIRVLFYCTALLTTVSGLHYMYVGMQIIQRGSRPEPIKPLKR